MKGFLIKAGTFQLLGLILLVSCLYADPEATPTPVEVDYFEVDVTIPENALMTFDTSGFVSPVTLTVSGRNDTTTTAYFVVDVAGNTDEAKKVYDELFKRIPTVKKLKKVKDKDTDNRETDADYQFVKKWSA